MQTNYANGCEFLSNFDFVANFQPLFDTFFFTPYSIVCVIFFLVFFSFCKCKIRFAWMKIVYDIKELMQCPFSISHWWKIPQNFNHFSFLLSNWNNPLVRNSIETKQKVKKKKKIMRLYVNEREKKSFSIVQAYCNRKYNNGVNNGIEMLLWAALMV